MKWPAQRQVTALVVVYGVLVLGRAAVIAFPWLPDAMGRFVMSTGQQNPTPAPPAAPQPAPAGSGTTVAPPPAVDSTEWPFSVEAEVKAKPSGLWTVAREFIPGPVRIRFEAEGTWKYSPESQCGPDGDMLSMISPSQTILKSAPVGSLIAKIGGSAFEPADVERFPRTECVRCLAGPVAPAPHHARPGMSLNDRAQRPFEIALCRKTYQFRNIDAKGASALRAGKVGAIGASCFLDGLASRITEAHLGEALHRHVRGELPHRNTLKAPDLRFLGRADPIRGARRRTR